MSGKEDIEKEISFSHSDHPTAIKRDSIHQHLQDDAERYTSSLLSETDDPTLPTLTFRAWVLGTFWCIVLGAINALGQWRTVPLVIDKIAIETRFIFQTY